MDLSRESKNPTHVSEHDKKLMRLFVDNRQKRLQSAKLPKAQVGDVLRAKPSPPTAASTGVESVEHQRSKSIVVYVFIFVGVLACLVWSATLFWLLIRLLILLAF